MNVKSMRYILLLLIATVSLRGVAQEEVETTPRRVVLDRVVAVVGSSSVLLSEVEAYSAVIQEHQRSEGYTSDRDTRAQALEELMKQRLMATQARIDSVEVNLLDITIRVEEQISSLRDMLGGIKELERHQNMEIFNIRDVLRRRMEEQAYAQGMQADVVNKVKIIPGEVEQFYKSHDRDALPIIGDQYRYAQITRFPQSMDDAKRRVKERLIEMRERVIKGDMKFSSLAQMYSVDPGSAYRGGEMEPQTSASFVPAFAEALVSLKPGQISEVVETEFGFHIIELIDQKGSLYHCRHILLRPTFTTDELLEPINFLDSLVGQIRRDSVTFEMAAQLHSHDDNSKMNGGIVTNHDLLERYNAYDAKLTETKFLKEDFGAYKSIDDYKALSRLKEGEISNPFATEDMLGNELTKIVKLVEIFPTHEASLEEDYIKLEALALADKQEKALKAWLARHIKSTYIYIDPEFRGMEFEFEGWVK
ncbi:MAG: peptidylprolyl isomerase [Rikenellaceae bacterium]